MLRFDGPISRLCSATAHPVQSVRPARLFIRLRVSLTAHHSSEGLRAVRCQCLRLYIPDSSVCGCLKRDER